MEQPNAFSPINKREQLKAARLPPETKKPPPLFNGGLYTADWLQEQEFPELQFAVDGIIPEGLSLLVGSPKVGKSWISLAIALAVASGGKALGHIDCVQRPVLLLALEDGRRRMQGRIKCLLQGREFPQKLEIEHRIIEDRLVSDIKKWVYDHYDPHYPEHAPLVFLDTLGKGMPSATPGSNESVYNKDYKIGSLFKSVTDDYPGTSLSALHHDRKAEAEDFVQAVSGSNALAGAADAIILMQRSRNEDVGILNVTGRDIIERKYSIIKDPDTNQWQLAEPTLEASAAKATTSQGQLNYGDNMKAVMDYVITNGPVGAAEIKKQFGSNAGTWLYRLADTGKITKLGRGMYAGPGIPAHHKGA